MALSTARDDVKPAAADEVERKALERAEAGAHERRGFTVSRDRSGVGYRISGHVTDEGAARPAKLHRRN